MKSTIRKKLGKAKCFLIDELPYASAMKGINALREKQSRQLDLLKPLESGQSDGVEVHVLCGTSNADMGMWATWSLMRFIPDGKLILHSDGTISDEDLDRWKRIIPNMEFVTKESRDEVCREKLDDRFPAIAAWRRANPYSSKAIDTHFYGSQSRLLVIDSDVLCFAHPEELLRNYANEEISFSWNPDERTCYTAPISELERVFACEIPEYFNSGILVTKRFDDDDMAMIDEVLRTCDSSNINMTGWFEQTLTAILAGQMGGGIALGEDYRVVGGKTKADAVMRHYVGVPRIRFRFFKEGVARLIEDAALVE